MQEPFQNTSPDAIAATPLIVPRPDHGISRANISENALKVLYRLKQENFQAHLVGGGVRDLLLGHEPKDFDVATDATPEEVRQVFRNCRLIGRRFRLAHVHFGREIIEVATFRGTTTSDGDENDRQMENGRILRDNTYGTIAEDALRRDFTVNALYYNIADFSLIDYADGLEDIKAGRLRLIGDPEQRYREDPVRMLRAVRFACKLGFTIEPQTEQPLFELAHLLADIAPARLFDELIKLFHSGYGLGVFEKLRQYGLFGELFPATEDCLAREDQGFPLTFVSRGLANTDKRLHEDKSVTPAFLFGVLLWEPVRQRFEEYLAGGEAANEAMFLAASEICARQHALVAIPKRFSLPMREIWSMQPRLEQRDGKRPQRLVTHPRFRAAYDFLVLRAESGEADPELAAWWTRFQEASGQERATMTEGGAKRRRRRPRRRKTGDTAGPGTEPTGVVERGG
ncbi:polynucleotide adenylyltransferase PcnB [Thiocapsa roseopersicina]|uniref:Poly(A) polymerase I n=1 Tax=Thiocapsa roseopersicina TaxID=1058 RepID=A0A1H2TPA2_THIRO|nr:polynucleotide adenylyltransferase PcnB [Thiocapsa roseopersicina]SDW45615.1 poly(A) polymerase [Thiocapsa roseopersicina]